MAHPIPEIDNMTHFTIAEELKKVGGSCRPKRKGGEGYGEEGQLTWFQTGQA